MMKTDWKMKALVAFLILMLSLSLMPSISSSMVSESAGTDGNSSAEKGDMETQTNPSDLGRVLIGYAGIPGSSYALLFYDYERNRFYICWELADFDIAINCFNAGGDASYYIWLRITDNAGNGTVIVDEKWDGLDQYDTYGKVKAVDPNKDASEIVWPLKWELTCILAGTHKSDFWDKVDTIVDTVTTVLTIIALVTIIVTAVASVGASGGTDAPIAGIVATEAALAIVKIGFELFKSYVISKLEDEIIDWLKDSGWDPGDENSWATVLLGVVNENVSMDSEVTIDLSGPEYVQDTYDSYEDTHGPYELRQYTVNCRAKKFNMINLTFSTPEEIEDVNPLITHPGSEIASFCSTGVDSPDGDFERDVHHLQYRWDAGWEFGNYPTNPLKYFWHDEYGNPYWEFGFIVDIDPEHADGLGETTITQEYVAEIEVFGIDYYVPGGTSKTKSTQISVDVEFDYGAPFYTCDIYLNISTYGEYILIIPLQQNKSMIIPIIVYPSAPWLSFLWIGIPDIPEQEEEAMVVVPKLGDCPLILTDMNMCAYPQAHMIFLHTPHIFFSEENTRIYVDLTLLGESHRIMIEKPGETDHLSIIFPEPEEYVAIMPEMPLPPIMLLWVSHANDAIVITPEISSPLQDLTISMPYPAKTTYVWIPSGKKVQINLLKQRTPTILTHLNQSGLYAEVLLNETHLEMYYFQTGLTIPFASAALSKPEGEPPSVVLVDSHTEWIYGLNVTSDPSEPSVSLIDVSDPTPPLYKVELTAYMNLYPHPYNRSICKKPNKDIISGNLTFSSGTSTYCNSNVSINEGVTITVTNDAKLIFNNTNIIGNYTTDGTITIQVDSNASVTFVDSQIHKIVEDGITDYYFNVDILGNASLEFTNSSIITTSPQFRDRITLSDNSQARIHTSLLYWNDEGFIICKDSAELFASWSYISEVSCFHNATLTAYLGSRILYTNLFNQSRVHAINGPDVWHIYLTDNSNFTVYDTTYTRKVTIEDFAHLTLAENSSIYGTHVSGTKPLGWTINNQTTQVVWGPHSKIIREHKIVTTCLDNTIWPNASISFHNETQNVVFGTATNVIGYASVSIAYTEINCSDALYANASQCINAPTFNINSKGPVRMVGAYLKAYDVAITNIAPNKTVVGQGYDVRIDVTVENNGNFTEIFHVVVFADLDMNITGDEIVTATQTVTLGSRNSAIVAFIWNTTDVAKGNYTISANATILPDEIDIADNTLADGWIIVTIPGDVNGDKEVDVFDKVIVGGAFGATYNATDGMYWHQPPDFPTPCPYCPHPPIADINNDCVVDIYDKVIVGYHFGEGIFT